jgi:hypothetical protein
VSDPTETRSRPPDPINLDERKERVLHTRVPESLDRHLKRRARGLGMSVSTIVRNVLLNTFGLVEDIVTDSTNVALSLAGEDRIEPAPATETAPVVGWQEIVMNLNAVCDLCNAVVARGSRGAIGVRERPGPRTIICPGCLDGLRAADGGSR